MTFEVLKNDASVPIEKKVIREFLTSYCISNQRSNNMKRIFIQLVKVLQEHDLIKPDYQIIYDGYYNSVE